MRYTFSYSNSHRHFIDIQFSILSNGKSTLELHLPSWRPGRYELGNFAKNIADIKFLNEHDAPLDFKKKSKDCWVIDTHGSSEIHARYSYYANQPDAGSCFLDETQLYINPVHCCLFSEDERNKPCLLSVVLPKNYEVATSLLISSPTVSLPDDLEKEIHSLYAGNYDELVDSPFIASSGLLHHSFEHEKTIFHLWFHGECKPDLKKISSDFMKFISEQLAIFKSFPFSENQNNRDYHFIFMIHPYAFHHGVEHLNSTVIAMGPSYEVFTNNYSEFLGISSHEFFHSWNIKTIRPVEMMPYDYMQENYSRLGYVAEGVTTYYGDLMLLRSGVYSVQDYFGCLEKQLNKHFHNEGRHHYSVADSSFDTWLDGYVPGIPGRKVSIYTEGCLFALMLDFAIRDKSGDKYSLDDVMKKLFDDFGKTKKGYSEFDYQLIAEGFAACDLKEYFDRYCNGFEDFEPMLEKIFDSIGCEIKIKPSEDFCEDKWGIKYIMTNNGAAKVTSVASESPAILAGIAEEDEILMVNDVRVNNNLADLCHSLGESDIRLLVLKKNRFKHVGLIPGIKNFYRNYLIVKKENATEMQISKFKSWSFSKSIRAI